MKILIATNNEHKIEEIRQVTKKTIPDGEITFFSPKDFAINISPAEDYDTFEENAYIKAFEFYNIAKIPVIADDSGLEIKALNNQPGVNSARFAGNHNDAKNRRKILELLKNETHRIAQFRTVIAYYNGNEVQYFNGICTGKIINEERGENGFGYDSIFIPDGYNKTFAEMTILEKNNISHRYKAIKEFLKMYDNYIK